MIITAGNFNLLLNENLENNCSSIILVGTEIIKFNPLVDDEEDRKEYTKNYARNILKEMLEALDNEIEISNPDIDKEQMYAK